MVTPERFTKGTALVVPGEEKVEERDDGALKLGSTSSVDGGGGECLPDNRFANIGGNEKRDTGTETIPLCQELVQEDDNKRRRDELDDEQEANTGAEVTWLTIETTEDIDSSLDKGNDHSED